MHVFGIHKRSHLGIMQGGLTIIHGVNWKIRCQSCGMQLKDNLPDTGLKMYGTDSDGSINPSYCKYCYINGKFSEPGLTEAKALRRFVETLQKENKIPLARANSMALEVIPKLKRWKRI